jgi:hypothetical protein
LDIIISVRAEKVKAPLKKLKLSQWEHAEIRSLIKKAFV